MLPQLPLRVAITVICAALIAVHFAFPLSLDLVTLGLLAVGLLPWLQPIFKTVKLPGGVEITLQDMKQEIKAAVGAAQSAERKAELAVSGVVTHHVTATDRAQRTNEMSLLARRYEETRAAMSSGPTRTSAMTAVVREMIEVADLVPEAELPVLLRSSNPGDRLAAYACLYGQPRPSLLTDLVTSVTAREDKPFGQYWGLQAISRNLPSKAEDVPDAVLRDLATYASAVAPGSDRDYEVRKLLAQIRGQRPSAA